MSLETLKEELKLVPFDKLLKIQSDIGSKAFKKNISSIPLKSPLKNKSKDSEMSSTSKKRFNESSGHLNQDLYKKSYGFIDDMKKDEITRLKNTIKKTNQDPEEKEKLQRLLQQLESKEVASTIAEKRTRLKREWKKSEKDLVREGKNPYYLKKGDLRKLELVDQFNDMKGKDVDKFLQKRRQKNATKEHRFMPYKKK